MIQEDIRSYQDEHGLRWYETPAGVLPSVTTILKETASKEERDRIRKWQHKVDKLHGKGTAGEESSQAKSRGTDVHKLIEEFLSGSSLDFPSNEYFAQALPFLKMIKSTVCSIEFPVYYYSEYAGRLDAVAIVDGKLSVIDFTTSKRLKRKQWLDNKFLQCAAYSIAYNWIWDESISSLTVVVMSPDKLQVFDDVVETYSKQWLDRVQWFWEKHGSE